MRYLEKDVGEDNYAIITTDPSPLAATVHDRMPVILSEIQAKAWLDPEYKNKELGQKRARVALALVLYADVKLKHPVSHRQDGTHVSFPAQS